MRRIPPLSYDTGAISAVLDAFPSAPHIQRLKQGCKTEFTSSFNELCNVTSFSGFEFLALVNDQKQLVTSSGSLGRAWCLVMQLGNFNQLPLEFDQGNAVEASERAWDCTCVTSSDISVMKMGLESCTLLSPGMLCERTKVRKLGHN